MVLVLSIILFSLFPTTDRIIIDPTRFSGITTFFVDYFEITFSVNTVYLFCQKNHDALNKTNTETNTTLPIAYSRQMIPKHIFIQRAIHFRIWKMNYCRMAEETKVMYFKRIVSALGLDMTPSAFSFIFRKLLCKITDHFFGDVVWFQGHFY